MLEACITGDVPHVEDEDFIVIEFLKKITKKDLNFESDSMFYEKSKYKV